MLKTISTKPLFIGFTTLVLFAVFSKIVLGQSGSSSTIEALTLSSVEPFAETELITIADEYYRYSFQVPAIWYREMGVTPDRWRFLSDSSIVDNGLIHPEPTLDGVIKIDFGVETVASLLPEPEVRNALFDEMGGATADDLIPLLPAGEWTEANGVRALLISEDEDILTQGHIGYFERATSIYILDDQLVYYFWVAFAPPIRSINDTAVSEKEYNETIRLILESFVLNPTVPAAWQPIE